jgi:hypothetical protein
MTARTRKTTKVSDEERFERLGEMRRTIRDTDPNLSNREVDRRAHEAVGLEWGGDLDSEDVPKGGRPRAAARSAGRGAASGARKAQVVVTSSGARKTIAGVLLLGGVIGILRDFRSGDAIRTDIVPRRIIGSFIAGILLMALAGPAPRVARGLAFLVGFTIVALNQDTIARIGGAVTDEGVEREGGTGVSVTEDQIRRGGAGGGGANVK